MEPQSVKTYEELLAEYDELRWQLEEANDTIHAIRSGQVDALVVQRDDGPELYSLKTADQTYRVFIEQMSEGALTLNDAGLILYSNSTFATLLGLSLSQVLGSALEDFITEDCREDYRRLFEQGWAKPAKMELKLSGAERAIPCQLSLTTLSLDEGLALSVIVTDLSYQKEVEELLRANNERLLRTNAALEQSNYDLLQFASVASHDLQEPLRKIMVFTDLLSRGVAADFTFHLAKISGSAARMKALIADILAYSRLSKEAPAAETFPLAELIAEIVEDFEILIAEKGATVTIGKLPVIQGSRGQMRQVFQNLISNALKFSRPGVPPRISITCEPEGNTHHCIIEVTDNGIGFDEQYSDKIFSLFQRLNTKDHYEGSGIGLAVTKKIVEQHGGEISATSEEGVGSTFCIVLPATL